MLKRIKKDIVKNVLLVLCMLVATAVHAQGPVCATPGADGVQPNPDPKNSFFPGMGDDITVNAGATSFDLDPIPPPFTIGGVQYDFGNNQISKGDLLLIIQIQGASIATHNDNRYGSGVGDGTNNGGGSGYLDLNNVGRYEYLVALNDVTSAGGTLHVRGAGPGNGLLYSYENKPADANNGVRRFQVIRMMQYSDLTLTNDIVTTPWNGKAGGLIAIDVAGTLDFNGRTINASMTGFRGGYTPQRTILNQQYPDYISSVTGNNSGGSGKGEGIAGTPRYVWDGYDYFDQGEEWVGYPQGDYSRGAPGNAGGGGNVHNGGGGGGGNGGAGGAGGYGWPLENLTPQSNNQRNLESLFTGGRPGAAMPSNVSNGLLFMGGGGGAGDSNNSLNGARGGVGGGLILITANKIAGTGYLVTNGGRGEPGNTDGTTGDGGGGGGAGGSVYINVKEPSPGAVVHIQAKGGNGGHATGADLHGPGGGGGGGIIYYNVNGAYVTTDASRGVAGLITNGNPVDPTRFDDFPLGQNKLQNGAFHGSAGIVSSFAPEDVPPYLATSAYCYPELYIKKWRENPLDSIPAGSTVTYKIQITNAGGGAKGVRVNDVLPAGFQFVSATIAFDIDPLNPQQLNNMGTLSNPVLGPFNLVTGEGAYIEMQVHVPFNTPIGTYHNGVQVGYFDPSRQVGEPERIIFPPINALPGQATDYAEGDEEVIGSNYHPDQEGEEVVVQKPEIGILKTVNSACVDPINNNTYSIVLINPNPFDLEGIVVTDIIHSELDIVSVSGAGWTHSNVGNTYSLTLDVLASGSELAPFTSAPVYITVKPKNTASSLSWLNTATVPTSKGISSSSIMLYQQPTQATASDATPVDACTGGIFYLNGNTPTVGVGKWEFVDASGNAYFENSNQSNTRILGMAPEQTVSVVWTITNASCGSVSSPPLSFTRPPTPTATISGGGTLCAGAPITTAQNITITLTPAAGRKRIKYIDGGGFERVVVTDAGATSYTFTPQYPGSYTLLEIKSGGTNADPNHSSWGPTNCPGIISGVAMLNVVTQTPMGGVINYHGGPVCRGEVVPMALILSGQSGTVVGWQSSLDGETWSSIIPGTANLTSYSPVVTQNIYYRAVLRGGSVDGSPCFLDQYSASVYLTVKDCNDLSIEKTADNMAPDAESEIVFTLTAKNLKQANATGVNVYDKLPNGYDYISHVAPESTTYDHVTGIWDIGTLNASQQLELTITVKVNSTGQYTNKAVISCTEQETDYANNTASITPDVNCDIRNVSPKVTK